MKTGYRRGTRILCAMIAAFFVIASIPSDIMAAETVQEAEQIATAAETDDQAEVFAGSSDDASDETEAEASAETDDADDELMGDPTDTATIYFNIGNCRVDEENMQGITDLEGTSSSNPDTWNGSGTVVARTLFIPFDVSDGYSLWDEYADATDYSIIRHNIRVECDGQEIDNYSFDDKNETLTINIPTDKDGKSIYVSAVAVGHKTMKYQYSSSMDPMPDKLEVVFTEGVDENGKSMGKEIKGVVRLTSGDSTPVSKLLAGGRDGYYPDYWRIGTDHNSMSNFGFERKIGSYVAEHEFTIPKELVRAHELYIGYNDWHGHENNEDIIVFLDYSFANCSVYFRGPDFVKIYKYEIGEGLVNTQFPMESPISYIMTHGERGDFHFCVGDLPDRHHVSRVELVREVVDEANGTKKLVTKSLPAPVTETVGGQDYTYYTIPEYEINTSINLVYVNVIVATDDDYVPESFSVDYNTADADEMTFYFEDEYCNCELNEVKFAPGTVEFTYTVETKGNKIPAVSLKDDDGHEEVIIPVSCKLNEDGSGTVFTYKGSAYTYSGKSLYIGCDERDFTLTVDPYGMDANTLKVKDEGGNKVNADEENSREREKVFNVEPYKEYTVYMEPVSTKVVKYATVNGRKVDGAYNGSVKIKIVPRISDYKDEGIETKNSVGYSFYSDKNNPIHLVIGGVDYNPDSTVYINDKDKTPFNLLVTGESNPEVNKVEARQNNKALEGFATVASATGITIYPSVTASEKPVTVTITGEEDSKDGERKSFTRKLNFVIMQDITEVKLTGTGTDNTQKTITQELGTEMSFGITVNGNVPFDGLGVETSGDSEAWIDKTARKLYVRTYKTETEDEKEKITLAADDGFNISFTYNGEPIEGAAFKVNCTLPAFAAPGASTLTVSDIGAVISMTAHKGIEKYRNAFFEVTPVRTEGAAPFYDNIAPSYVRTDSLDANALKLSFAPADQEGKEHGSAKYSISVKVVQLSSTLGGAPAAGYSVRSSASAKNKKFDVKTKEFAYEVKLSLSGKTPSFIRGQKNVLVALAKFSGKTSVAELDENMTFITDANGVVRMGDEFFGYSSAGHIYLKKTSDLAIGTATLTAYPKLPEYVQCSPATVKLTVKAPITAVSITPAQSRLYKAKGKAATLKLTATLSSDEGYKPASKNVKWEVTAPAGLARYVSVKNGTVTVAKDFVPSGDQTENRFTVVATAADYESDEARSDFLEVEISNRAEQAKSVEVYDGGTKVDVNLSAAAPSDLFGRRLVFKDAYGRVISPSDLSIKVSPNTMKISADGTITSLTKDGNYKLTVTSEDGSKAKMEKVIKVNPSAPEYTVSAYTFNGDTAESISAIPGVLTTLGNETTLVFVADRRDSSLTNTSKFTVMGGKKINLGPSALGVLESGVLNGKKNFIVFAIKPTEENITVTFSPDKDKANDKVYKIRNVIGGNTLRADDTEIIANSEGKTYKFTFSTDYAGDDFDEVKVFFKLNESILTSKKQADYDAAKKIMHLLNNLSTNDHGVTRKKNEKTVTFRAESLNRMPKGNYKIDAVMVKGNDPIAKPLTVTFKVVDAKAPKFALKGDVTLATGETKPLEFKSAANGTLVAGLGLVFLNNNSNGKINNFVDHFTITLDETGKITITQTSEPSDADRIGWISYQVKGMDGRIVTFTDKVTVKKSR